MTKIDLRHVLLALSILKLRSDPDSRATRAGILKKWVAGKNSYPIYTPVLFRPRTDSCNIVVVTFPLSLEDLKKIKFTYEPVVKDLSLNLDKSFVAEIVLE